MTSAELHAKGKQHGFPSVRLKKGQTLNAGEHNWFKYLRHAKPFHLEMLESALWRGWSEGPGCVGMIRE